MKCLYSRMQNIKPPLAGYQEQHFFSYIRFGRAASLFDALASELKLLVLVCFALELNFVVWVSRTTFRSTLDLWTVFRSAPSPWICTYWMAKSNFLSVLYIDSHKVPSGLSVPKLNLSFYEVFLTSTRTKCRKGCTHGNAHSNFMRHFWHRHAENAKRVVRAQTQPIILRGAFDIDTHKVPWGLHVLKCTFNICEVFLTWTRTKCREGCPCSNSTFHFMRCFRHRHAQSAAGVARTEMHTSISRGVFNIDTHKVPRGLHRLRCKLQLYEALLTLTRTKCREGCPWRASKITWICILCERYWKTKKLCVSRRRDTQFRKYHFARDVFKKSKL